MLFHICNFRHPEQRGQLSRGLPGDKFVLIIDEITNVKRTRLDQDFELAADKRARILQNVSRPDGGDGETIGVRGLEPRHVGLFQFRGELAVGDVPDVFCDSEQHCVQDLDRCVFGWIEAWYFIS